ncbi:DoxX family protein [Pelobium manganitolerans]|uniref:DoxX family protein n=1 Tax=Pelobium manganitolerans TaxID=1842495 RepID=A0A419SBJ8_9SPHI|nr:DoxX family protein [Pelobium manganitolerans]RKD20189.1 DoxX family protein [Pelobium manganitolerans]
MNKNRDLSLLVLRLGVGILMLMHGVAKLKGIGFIEGMLAEKGIPGIVAYGVYITEVIAPLLIIIGYRTRLAAIFLILGAITAMLLVHSADIFQLNQAGGWAVELLGLFITGALSLAISGGGKYALSSKNKWD